MTQLDSITIEPTQPATHSVIWMHGLGADGSDFVPIVSELGLPADHRVRFVFPHAPMMPVTINQGYVMRAWYDITSLSSHENQDEAGIKASEVSIRKLIQAENDKGIATENIILAGFSQGGAMALYAGLCYPEKLAGVIALSCYLPLHHVFQNHKASNQQNTSIFMAHGIQDPVVPYMAGRASSEFLKQQGYPMEWHDYPIQHSVCPEEIVAIGAWFKKLL